MRKTTYYVSKLLFALLLSILATNNAIAANIHWELKDSPISVESDLVIPIGDVLSIDAGTEVNFSKDVVLLVQGKIEVLNQGAVILNNVLGEQWQGVQVESDETFVISNLHISNASIGIKLTSSPNVTLSNNLFENNNVGISLSVNDGIRSNVNVITDNEILNNGTGISATSTGADIQRNLIANNTNYGINLGGSAGCGANSACGWRSTVQNNLISDSEVGVNVYGHHLTMNSNDIYNTTVGISNHNFNGTSYSVTDNNIVGWSAFAYVNKSADSVNSGNLWLGQPESTQSVCDVEDNINRGAVTFVASTGAFPTNHNHDLPIAIESETITSHSSCPDDGYQYVATDMSWTVAESPITIDESLFIASSATLTIESGTEVIFNSGVGVMVEGSLLVSGSDYAYLSAAEEAKWQGVTFKRSSQEVISKLHVTDASYGIKIISSDGLAVSNNLLADNSVGISLNVDDGTRSNVNAITDNEILNNGTGISATRTGADIQRNLIANNTNYGINLGGSAGCGANSACGWRSTVQNNLISDSEVGVNVYGHHLTMNSNDIYNTTVGISNHNFNGTSYSVTDNNIVGWSAFAYVNKSADSVNSGNLWLGQPESTQSVCDVEDNINRGAVTFVASTGAFPTNHNHDLPIAIESETITSHSSCPDDGYQYVATDMSWTLAESPITIDESLFIASSATLTIESGTEVIFNSGVGVMVEGSLLVSGSDYAYLSAAEEAKWQGVTFKRSSQEVISKLHVTDASYGIKIISSDGLAVSNNLLADNSVGISLNVDDGTRSNVNAITDNEILNNGTGISATRTGADIQRNLIANNTNYGINLGGGSCGSGSVCGWRSIIQENLISGSNVGVNVFAHNLTMVSNDISSTSSAIILSNLKEGNLLINSNNISSISDFAIKNVGALDIDFGEIWISDERLDEEIIYDFYDHNSKGIARLVRTANNFINNFTLVDTDSDGLANIQEYELGSNPMKKDTDGDGLEDGIELVLGTSPILFDSDSDGLTDTKDAYPLVAIGELTDTDSDGAPDTCDDACVELGMAADTDDDNDGIVDTADAYPLIAIGELTDTDSDGAPDTCNEACIELGMAADTDDDNDGVVDTADAYPLIAIGELTDTDSDGAPDTCDESLC